MGLDPLHVISVADARGPTDAARKDGSIRAKSPRRAASFCSGDLVHPDVLEG
jgi:hypothetical protein